MKAVVAAFNQEKALVGAFYVITNLRMELFQALALTLLHATGSRLDPAHCVRVADGGRRRGGAGAGEAARSGPRTVPYLTQGNAYYPLSPSSVRYHFLSAVRPAPELVAA